MIESSIIYNGEIDNGDPYYELMRTLIENKEKADVINLYLNSTGGDFSLGMALIDAMNLCKKNGVTIKTIAIGKVQSIAFLIFANGKKRYSFEHADFMLHSPSLQFSNDLLNTSQLIRVSKYMQINCEAVEKCLRETVNKTNWKAFQKEYIDVSGDHYMSASTLKFYGVVDKIIEKWDDIK